jgi:hypothetical protein
MYQFNELTFTMKTPEASQHLPRTFTSIYQHLPREAEASSTSAGETATRTHGMRVAQGQGTARG